MKFITTFLFLFSFNCLAMVDYEPAQQKDAKEAEEVQEQNNKTCLLKNWAICCICCYIEKNKGESCKISKSSCYQEAIDICSILKDAFSCIERTRDKKFKGLNCCCFSYNKYENDLSKLEYCECCLPPLLCISYHGSTDADYFTCCGGIKIAEDTRTAICCFGCCQSGF